MRSDQEEGWGSGLGVVTLALLLAATGCRHTNPRPTFAGTERVLVSNRDVLAEEAATAAAGGPPSAGPQNTARPGPAQSEKRP